MSGKMPGLIVPSRGRRTGSARSRSAFTPTRSSTGSSRSASSRGRPGAICASPAEIPEPGDWVATTVGEVAVIVARGPDGAINAFVNRCAHRGNLLCLTNKGHGKEITCIYHGWSYDLEGRLTGGRVRARRQAAGRHGARVPQGGPPSAAAAGRRIVRSRVRHVRPERARTSKPISARSSSAA